MPEQLTFTQAMNRCFGKKEGQSMAQFADELKKLTPEDKEYFKAEFAKVGIEVVEQK